MEELAKLEAERGTPGYMPVAGIAKSRSAKNSGAEAAGGNGRGGMADGLENAAGRKGKEEARCQQ